MQSLVAAAHRRHVFLLCIHQRRGIELEKHLATFDWITGSIDRKVFDPAIDSRIDLEQRLLIVRDVTDCLDTS